MSEEKLHRLFIGCDVSDEFRTNTETVIEQLKKKLDKKYSLNWAFLSKIHFTLRFLGNTEETKIDLIKNAIEQIIKNHNTLQLELRNIDFFPKNRPHVLVINLRLTEELARLYADVNRALEACEIAKENRIFLPHITLARFRDVRAEEEHFEKEFSLLPKKIKVDKLYLFESNQEAREEEYKKLKEFLLASGQDQSI